MTSPIPLLDLQAQYRPLRDQILQAMTAVSDSQRFILGPEVEAFEAEIAARLGVRHAIGVSSGTDALLVAMMALGIGPGDEVIVPTYSFFATAGCVSRLGATPVLTDIDPGTFNIDVAAAEAAITPRTRAIIPVHLFGQTADLDPLLRVANRHGIAVIEDACQAIGARYKGRQAGGIGHRRLLLVLPEQEPRRFRRRRPGRHERRPPGTADACAPRPRGRDEVPTTRSSAATSASTPCRLPCCA